MTLALVANICRPAVGTEWAAFAYLAVVSMFLGFFAYQYRIYQHQADGPISRCNS